MAPLVLLLAAGVVASAGGLTSIASLGEIASGPSLPDIGLNAQPGAALENADIVGADLSPADSSAPAAPSPDALASAAPQVSEPADAVDVAPPGAPPQPVPVQPFRLREPPATGGGGETAPTAPPAPRGPPAVPAPVEDLLEATRGLGDSLRPLTDALRELLGPPSR